MNAKKLEWDSDFFGVNIISVNFKKEEEDELESFLDGCKADGIDLVYAFSEKENIPISILKKYSGTLVDKKVIYTGEVKPNKKSPFVITFDSAPSILYFLASQSGIYSRFNKDIYLKKDFLRLYHTWIENSVRRVIADEVFVYLEESEIRGLMTIANKSDTAAIGLLSVTDNSRGKGVGSILIQYLNAYCFEKKLNYIEVATQQDNIPACKFYEKCGLAVSNITYVYHFWLNKKY